MSQAFVREDEDNGLLHQVAPTLPALIRYLKKESNAQQVYVVREEKKNGVDTWVMSNGVSYFINKDNNWEMLL